MPLPSPLLSGLLTGLVRDGGICWEKMDMGNEPALRFWLENPLGLAD